MGMEKKAIMKTLRRFRPDPIPAIIGASLTLLALNAAAADGAEFYKGKTVTYIVSTAAGGSYDTYGRVVAEYMQRHLPGSKFIVKNVPGAGHLIGANAIYGAKPDGLTLGTFNTGLIYSQMVGMEAAKFDLTKMSWIGKAASEPRVIMISSKSPIKTFEDLRILKEPVNFSASGVGSSSYVEAKMLIDVLKLPIKIVPGFSGTEGEMAMRRAEVFGTVGSRSSFEGFVKNGYGRYLVQMGGKDKDVPQLSQLVTDPKGKAVVALIESQGEIARLTAGPPGIPKDRLEALRKAFKQAMQDKGLQERLVKLGLPLDPAYGDDVLKLVTAAMKQSPETVAMLAQTMDVKQAVSKAEGAPDGKQAISSAEGPLLEVNDKGREIVFAGPDNQKVQSKPSGSRTKITIAGKEAKREDLKAGLVCALSYKPGGDNEPSAIDCK